MKFVNKNPIFKMVDIKKLNPVWLNWNLSKHYAVYVYVYNRKVFNFKLATDPISRDNFESAEIWEITNFRGLKADQWLKSLRSVDNIIKLFMTVSCEFS